MYIWLKTTITGELWVGRGILNSRVNQENYIIVKLYKENEMCSFEYYENFIAENI